MRTRMSKNCARKLIRGGGEGRTAAIGRAEHLRSCFAHLTASGFLSIGMYDRQPNWSHASTTGGLVRRPSRSFRSFAFNFFWGKQEKFFSVWVCTRTATLPASFSSRRQLYR